MKNSGVIRTLLLSAAILMLVPANKALSIPAFARKYQISCQVCHAPAMPRLKGFGEEFAGNGFRLTEYESPRYYIETGDDRLSLFRELPLAFRLDGFASYNFDDAASVDFGSPFVLKILSGGEISDRLSYYFYFLLNERGSIAGVEDAFLQYHDLFGAGINFFIGQFQASDPLFKGELRYTLESYHIYGVSPGSSSANLKYDRGIILEKDLPTGTTLLGQVLNGCGIGEATEGFLFDKDKYKNFMGKISQSVGEKFTLGVFGYTGKELINGNSLVFDSFTSNIKMWGTDLTLDLDEKLIVNLQYIRRSDSEVFYPYGGTPAVTIKDVYTYGGFAEVIFSPRGDMSKWYLTGLYNYVNSDVNELGLDYESATLHAGYLLRRNLRLVAEYTQVLTIPQHGKVNAGFITAF